MKHIMAILISVFPLGYHQKTIDSEKYTPCHHTTVAHFLNKRKWDDGWMTYSKALSSRPSIGKSNGLESLCPASWMTHLLQIKAFVTDSASG